MRRGNGITRQFPKIVSRKGQLQEKSKLPPKRVRNKNHLRGEVKFSRKKSTSSTFQHQPLEHHISKPLFRIIKIRATSNIIHKEKPIYPEKPRTTNSNRQSITADSKEEDRRGASQWVGVLDRPLSQMGTLKYFQFPVQIADLPLGVLTLVLFWVILISSKKESPPPPRILSKTTMRKGQISGKKSHRRQFKMKINLEERSICRKPP